MSAGNGAAPDAIDTAIAATTVVPIVRADFELMSGRPVSVTVPQDITDSEILSLIAYVLQMRDRLHAQAPIPGLVRAAALPT